MDGNRGILTLPVKQAADASRKPMFAFLVNIAEYNAGGAESR